jgi:DNA-binding CsgD family transcriptional regulator
VLAARRLREGVRAFADLGRVNEVHEALVDLARVALASDEPVRAARLLGLAEIFPSFQSFQTHQTEGIERVTTAVQARLGEAAFTAAVADGRTLAWAEALAEIDALIGTLANAVAPVPPTPPPTHGLSQREVEVLRLLADGQSNRAIAEALSLSERTIQTHVFHIFAKLRVSSRAAAAAYAVRHALI